MAEYLGSLGLKAEGRGFRVQNLKFRVQGSGMADRVFELQPEREDQLSLSLGTVSLSLSLSISLCLSLCLCLSL